MFLHYFLNIVFGIRVTDILALFLSWKPACGHATVHIFFQALQTVLPHGTKQPCDALEHAHFKP